MAWSDACSADIEKFCEQEKDTVACLIKEQDTLSSCCQAFTIEKTQGSTLVSTTLYKGLSIPAGSRLTNHAQCNSSIIETSSDVEFNGIGLKKGEIELYGDGGIKWATLNGEQLVNEFWFGGNKSSLQFYPSGHPKSGILSRESKTRFGVFGLGKTAFFSDGSVSWGYLADSLEVDGLVYGKGPIGFSEPGKVYLGTLAEDAVLGKLKLPAGTEVQWPDKKPNIVYTAPTVSQVGSLSLAGGVQTTVFPDQSLYKGVLAKDTTIEGRQLPAGTELLFRRNGELQWDSHRQAIKDAEQARIKRVTAPRINDKFMTHQGVGIPAGSTLRYNENEKLISFSSNEEITVNALNFQPGEYSFHKQWGIREGFLTTDQVIGGFLWRSSKAIQFHPNGSIQRGLLAEDVTYKGAVFNADTVLSLHDNGEIDNGTLSKDWLHNKFRFKAGTTIRFSYRGELRTGTLATKALIHNEWFPSGSIIEYNPDPDISAKMHTPKAITIQGLPLTGKAVVFDRQGAFVEGRLSEDATIAGKNLLSGTQFRMNRAGFVINSHFQKITTINQSGSYKNGNVVTAVQPKILFLGEERSRDYPLRYTLGKSRGEALATAVLFEPDDNPAIIEKRRAVLESSLHNSLVNLQKEYILRLSADNLEIEYPNVPAEQVCSHYQLSIGTDQFNLEKLDRISVMAQQTDLNSELRNLIAGSPQYRSVCRNFRGKINIVYRIDF